MLRQMSEETERKRTERETRLEAAAAVAEESHRPASAEEAWELWHEKGVEVFMAYTDDNRPHSEWESWGRASWYDESRCPVCRGDRQSIAELDYCPCFRAWQCYLETRRLLPYSLRDITLKNLKPHTASLLGTPVEQQREIDFIREHCHDGFVFLGPTGSSKSTFAAALLYNAIYEDALGPMESKKYIWRIDGRQFFEAEHAWVTGKEDAKRLITADDIRRARAYRFRPVLVLEEIDKRKMTEFNADCLFNVVNAMDENDGQLIVTTNLTVDGYAKLFSTSESESVRACGDAICRRLFKCEQKGRYVRNYWK